MTAEAVSLRGRHEARKTAVAAIAAGEVQQLVDGRAAVRTGLAAAASGDRTNWTTEGQFVMVKKGTIVCLGGFPAYWDHANNYVTPLKPKSGRGYFVGTFARNAASADATCEVNLNVRPVWEIELRKGYWTAEATNGLGVTPLVGGGVELAFDAVSEAAQAAIYSERTVPIASNPKMLIRMANFDKGDNAALDFDIGLASATHGTDFESVAEFVSVHFDGNALDIKAQSDDGTTDTAVADTTVDAVDDTFFEAWIDCSDPSDIQIYINGVLVLGSSTFTLAAGTGPVFPIALAEKTADDTTCDFRIEEMAVMIAEQDGESQ